MLCMVHGLCTLFIFDEILCNTPSDNGLMELMKKLPPASIDSEIRSLSPEHGGSLEGLQHFMEFMLSQLKTCMNFELIEAYLGLFLKVRVCS